MNNFTVKFIEVKYARVTSLSHHGFLVGTKTFYTSDRKEYKKVYAKAQAFARKKELETGYSSCITVFTMSDTGFYAPTYR